MTVNELAAQLFAKHVASLIIHDASEKYIRYVAKRAIRHADWFQQEWREHEKQLDDEITPSCTSKTGLELDDEDSEIKF